MTTLSYQFKNRTLQLGFIESKPEDYQKNLGVFFNSIRVLDKNHPTFKDDIALLAAHTAIRVVKQPYTKPTAYFDINAYDINTINPDTLKRLATGIENLPDKKTAPKIEAVSYILS